MVTNLSRPLIVGLVAALVLAGCGAGGASSIPIRSMPAMSSGDAMSLDQQFIDMMVPHHQAAVAMAEVALAKAEHAEVKALANDIIGAQTQEIGQLKEWRTAWFGSDQTPGMEAMPILPGMEMPGMEMPGGSMGSTMDMTKDVAKIKDATPFDRAFIEAMTEHHKTAIAAARIAEAQATKPEIKALAGRIIAAQQGEIDKMAAWLADWY